MLGRRQTARAVFQSQSQYFNLLLPTRLERAREIHFSDRAKAQTERQLMFTLSNLSKVDIYKVIITADQLHLQYKTKTLACYPLCMSVRYRMNFSCWLSHIHTCYFCKLLPPTSAHSPGHFDNSNNCILSSFSSSLRVVQVPYRIMVQG